MLKARRLHSRKKQITALAIILFIIICINKKWAATVVGIPSINHLEGSSQQISTISKTETPDVHSNTSFIKRQKARVKHIKKYCANFKHKLTKDYPEYKPSHKVLLSYDWIVSPHHELFYCATPKCASTTWKTYIMEDLGMKWTIDTHS